MHRPILLAILAPLLFAGCKTTAPDPVIPVDQPSIPAPPRPPIRGTAIIESVRFLPLESFPVEGFAYITAYLPDGATEIDRVTTTREGNQFTIVISTVRPAEAVATTELIPFERQAPLELAGLPAGRYTVVVGNRSTVFTLDRANIAR
jgi:inhibitor of cysteine peptidase